MWTSALELWLWPQATTSDAQGRCSLKVITHHSKQITSYLMHLMML